MTNPGPDLARLHAKLAAARRDTPPPADEAGRWARVIDQDTGKPCWFPKGLSEQWQTARWQRNSDSEGTP